MSLKPEMCPVCNGSGDLANIGEENEKCKVCQRKGFIEVDDKTKVEEREVNIEVLAGVKRTRIRPTGFSLITGNIYTILPPDYNR